MTFAITFSLPKSKVTTLRVQLLEGIIFWNFVTGGKNTKLSTCHYAICVMNMNNKNTPKFITQKLIAAKNCKYSFT